jgi:hypothetical protein
MLNHAMRLTEEQVALIKEATRAVLGDDAQVVLFGSCVDEQHRGERHRLAV